MACRAWACSATVICSKSFRRSTSLAEAVKLASISRSSFFWRCWLLPSCLSNMRFGQAPEPGLLGLLAGIAGHLMEEQLHQLLQHLGLLPEDVEGLVEDLALVAPLHEDGVQRPVEVIARR